MPLRDDLLNPIPGDNPSGANLRYDPVTDKIKEARREDLDVPQGDWKTALKAADLPAVIKMGSDALAKKGKDLQIAVWLVDAHVRKEGFPVLAPALQFLHDLLEQYWDTLYPPIDEDGDMEVRSAPLVWLGSKLGEQLGFLPIVSGKLSWLKYQESRVVGYEADADTGEKQEKREQAIKDNKVTGEQFDEAAEATSITALRDTYKQLNQSRAAVDELAEYCDTQFGDFTPSFIKVRDAIDEVSQTVRMILSRKPGGLEEEKPELDDDMSMNLDSSLESDSSSSSDSDFDSSTSSDSESESSSFDDSSSAGEGGDNADVARQLGSICKVLRSRDPENPAPYMMLRAFAWAGLMEHAPLISHDKITAPPSDLRVRLKRLTADSEWDKVIELTEASMLQPYAGYWFDLQRYAVNALEQKGYPSTARVVNNQFRILLECLPELLDLSLPDDTAPANKDTKEWIENFVIVQKYVGPPKTEGEGDSSSDSSSSDSFSFDDTSSSDSSSDSFSDTSSDTSSDFSFDTPSEEPAPDLEAAAEPTPEPELEPYEVEANPPILEAEEPPPTDTSDEFGMALAAVRDGRTAEGLGMITSILATERSGRARFRRRTQLAHLLMAAGKGKVAAPMLDQLVNEIEERRLEEWEPSEAIAYPLELLMHCLTSADDERRAQLYTKICKLDPVRAVNCSV
jgi:type VI secretion system protein ImpA